MLHVRDVMGHRTISNLYKKISWSLIYFYKKFTRLLCNKSLISDYLFSVVLNVISSAFSMCRFIWYALGFMFCFTTDTQTVSTLKPSPLFVADIVAEFVSWHLCKTKGKYWKIVHANESKSKYCEQILGAHETAQSWLHENFGCIFGKIPHFFLSTNTVEVLWITNCLELN